MSSSARQTRRIGRSPVTGSASFGNAMISSHRGLVFARSTTPCGCQPRRLIRILPRNSSLNASRVHPFDVGKNASAPSRVRRAVGPQAAQFRQRLKRMRPYSDACPAARRAARGGRPLANGAYRPGCGSAASSAQPARDWGEWPAGQTGSLAMIRHTTARCSRRVSSNTPAARRCADRGDDRPPESCRRSAQASAGS